MAKPSLTIVRRIKAPPAKVYDAFTRPELIAKWWGPDAGPVLHAEADARVGGRFRIRFQTLDGEQHEMSGAYRVTEPGRRLVWDMTWITFPERLSVVTLDLAAIEGGTELTLHHDQLHDEEVRDSHVQGWNGMLAKLEPLLITSPERTADANA
jgi:uncharacterized protein YndB with AHSA1/START domain